MKPNSVTRCTLALIDNIKANRKSAARNARAFRKEFSFTSPKARWAAHFFTSYQYMKQAAVSCWEILRDHFSKMIKVLTLKPRFAAQEVAA